MARTNNQTHSHVGNTKHSVLRVLATYTGDAQYNYKSLSIVTTFTGLDIVSVEFVVEGRRDGKLFKYVYTSHDPATDKYNGIAY